MPHTQQSASWWRMAEERAPGLPRLATDRRKSMAVSGPTRVVSISNSSILAPVRGVLPGFFSGCPVDEAILLVPISLIFYQVLDILEVQGRPANWASGIDLFPSLVAIPTKHVIAPCLLGIHWCAQAYWAVVQVTGPNLRSARNHRLTCEALPFSQAVLPTLKTHPATARILSKDELGF